MTKSRPVGALVSYLNTVGVGEAAEYLRQVPDECIDACCTDAPYGLGKHQPDPIDVMRAWIEGREYEASGPGFMYSKWDAFVPGPAVWREVYRVLKPGGWLLSFFGARTYDWGVMAIRFAGFEVHDQIDWITGSGFPKSHNISKAIDALVSTGKSDSLALQFANDELREGEGRVRTHTQSDGMSMRNNRGKAAPRVIRDEPATPEGAAWKGWGTALKPSHEPIVLARKPFKGTYAEHVLEHGTGALNVDSGRIGPNPGWSYPKGKGGSPCHQGGFKNIACESKAGRWPSNVIVAHLPECQLIGSKRVRTGTAVKRNLPEEGAKQRIDLKARTKRGVDQTYADADGKEEVPEYECAPGCPVAELDEQSIEGGMHGAGSACGGGLGTDSNRSLFRGDGRPDESNGTRYGDAGGASRFFYTPKAAARERWSYCRACQLVFNHEGDSFDEHDDHQDEVVSHPTQKPLALMEYLVRLVTQDGGVVLDPFCGTGTTLVAAKKLGYQFVTCDRDEDYAQIARARLARLDAREPSALTSGAYFCPGCKAKGEIKLISRKAVERMRETGKKTTCMKCLKRFTAEELLGGDNR